MKDDIVRKQMIPVCKDGYPVIDFINKHYFDNSEIVRSWLEEYLRRTKAAQVHNMIVREYSYYYDTSREKKKRSRFLIKLYDRTLVNISVHKFKEFARYNIPRVEKR